MHATPEAAVATTVAVDLAKDVFELAFADAGHRILERKRLSRHAFAHVLDNRGPLRVMMEACGGAHYWARRLAGQGHTVRLLPARDVRPYVRRNKTDRTDVAGILEADRCAQIDPVPVKSPEQQGVQALHRIRERLKAQRTSTINLVRGVLREFGVIIPLGAAQVRPAVLAALEDGDNDLPMALRHTLGEMLERLAGLQTDMTAIEQRLEAFADRDPPSQRYQSVPEIGRADRRCLVRQCRTAGPVPQWPSLCGVAWTDPARALVRYASPPRRHAQAWRRLPTPAADSRRTRRPTRRAGSAAQRSTA